MYEALAEHRGKRKENIRAMKSSEFPYVHYVVHRRECQTAKNRTISLYMSDRRVSLTQCNIILRIRCWLTHSRTKRRDVIVQIELVLRRLRKLQSGELHVSSDYPRGNISLIN